MAKGKEIEDGTRRIRKGDRMEEDKGHSQSNKGKSKKDNKQNASRNGKDIDDGKDVPEAHVVQDSETEDGDEEDEVAHNDSDEDESGGDEEEEAEEQAEEEAAAENGGEKVKGGGSKKKKKRNRNENGKSMKKESDDSHCFPMNRISRIIKSEDPDIRITQETVFLVNKATEKFLELFCKEAYACASLESKNQVWYKHLSSVVSKRKRLDFLLDIVPEKVKAEDALAEMPVAET